MHRRRWQYHAIHDASNCVCDAAMMEVEGSLFNEGGAAYCLWCTVRARWTTHDGNIAIRGRTLVVMAVLLLFEGWYCCVGDGDAIIIWMI
jgi:hypothetical protein